MLLILPQNKRRSDAPMQTQTNNTMISGTATPASAHQNESRQNTPSASKPHDDSYFSDDFRPLALASDEILSALRADECAPDADLYRRLISSSGAASHRYHIVSGDGTGSVSTKSGSATSPTTPSSESPRRVSSNIGAGVLRGSQHVKTHKSASTSTEDRPAESVPKSPISSPPTPYLQHDHSIPLPAQMANEAKKAKLTSLMGLLPEANLVWLSADEKLFLWSYKLSDGGMDRDANLSSSWGSAMPSSFDKREDFCSFSVPSGQCIVTVGLVRPKKGTCPKLYYNLSLVALEIIMKSLVDLLISLRQLLSLQVFLKM